MHSTPPRASASSREVALLRLAAQRLVGQPEPAPLAAVRRLLAVQGQDLRGALTSVALRTLSRRRADVVAALDAGELVRSWPMRGTLHLVAAQDLPWLLHLLAARAVAASRGRRTALGLGETDLERARELAIAALTGGVRLSRRELSAAWEAGGLSIEGQRGVHLLRHLAMTGTLVLGPVRGSDQLVALLEEWVPQPRRLERDEALGELALRYFRGHGPAPPADLARWAGLVTRDLRTAVALARPQLATLDVDGAEHLLDPATAERLGTGREAADGVLLLPGFDELLLGYGDRSATLAPEHTGLVVPGGNGLFRATVVQAGRVVGTWRRTGRGTPQVEATPFSTPGPAAEDLERAAARLP